MSQLASYLITNDLQIAKFSSQVSWLASYLIRPPPLIHFLLLASSTLHPLAFPPISSDMPSRFHCLISLFLPNISMLKCPRAIDTHENQPGLVTSSMSTLFPAIILSHWAFALVAQLVSQLRPSLLTDYSPHSYQSDRLIVLKTLSSQLPFLLLAADRQASLLYLKQRNRGCLRAFAGQFLRPRTHLPLGSHMDNSSPLSGSLLDI